jgi:hypothetical protein
MYITRIAPTTEYGRVYRRATERLSPRSVPPAYSLISLVIAIRKLVLYVLSQQQQPCDVSWAHLNHPVSMRVGCK